MSCSIKTPYHWVSLLDDDDDDDDRTEKGS
jgi:hypothetical protein